MRATLFLAFTFTLGVSVMSEQAVADEKKIPNPDKKESYNLKLNVRYWDGKKFLKPIENVPAFKYEDAKGTIRFWTKAHLVTEGNPSKGSELILGDETWIVTNVEGGREFWVCTVKRKK
jgi:hypothetical protein